MNIEDKIVAGAAELFHKYGVRSVSMDDIARHLSISKKTIYQYFKDKNEVVLLSMKLHLTMKKKEYDAIFTTTENAIEQLAGVSRCMRMDLKDMNQSLLFDLQKYHPQAWQLWLNFKNDYIKNQVAENLRMGIKEGYYREAIDPEIFSRLRVEQAQVAFDESVFPKSEFDFKEVQIMFLDHFIHGIVTEKGMKTYQKFTQQSQKQESTL